MGVFVKSPSSDNTPYEKIGDEVRSLADEVPFDIPDSWEWVRLIDVCEYIQRGKSPKYSPIKKYPVIAQKCNQWSGFSIEKAQFIEPDSLASYGPERLLQDNDLMWNSTGLGTLGRMAIYKTADNPYELAVADSHVTVIRPLKQFVLPEYLYYYFANPTVQSVIEDQADGTTKQKELATATIKAYLTPIPPLNEQRRILAKLSEVLPVVKSYGTVYDETAAMQEAFPERLKKSILQEAVQGKLVPQDPSDEPAEALLERIREEKQRLIKEGKIKNDKHESVIFRRDNSHYEKLDGIERCIDDELPFEIPENWCWARLGSISSYAETKQKVNAANADPAIWGLDLEDIEKGGRLIVRKTVGERKAIGDKTVFSKGDILYSKLRPYLLKILVAPECGICTPEIVPFQVYGEIVSEYIVNFLRSPYVDNLINSITYGVKMPRVGTETMTTLFVPIPPIAEQHRIVRRIEELLPLVKGL